MWQVNTTVPHCKIAPIYPPEPTGLGLDVEIYLQWELTRRAS